MIKEEINSIAFETKHQSETRKWCKYKVGRIKQVLL